MIMACVRSVSFQILINGQIYTYFVPSKSFRHRDPLNSYLFVICVEGFSALIKRVMQQDIWSGILFLLYVLRGFWR